MNMYHKIPCSIVKTISFKIERAEQRNKCSKYVHFPLYEAEVFVNVHLPGSVQRGDRVIDPRWPWQVDVERVIWNVETETSVAHVGNFTISWYDDEVKSAAEFVDRVNEQLAELERNSPWKRSDTKEEMKEKIENA